MKDGAEMVLVPAGKYRIGSNIGPPDSRPAHEVALPAFYMDRTEVTNAQYVKYCIETGRDFPPHIKGPRIPERLGNLPVVNVKYSDAVAYARWAGKVLPTEAEWEAAARGKEARLYPWGDIFRPAAAIRRRAPAKVGSHPKDISPRGVLDMAGNVMEWTRDWYRSYPGARKKFDYYGYKRVVRGAHYRTRNRLECRTFIRRGIKYQTKSPRIGFRCVKEIRYR